MRRQPGHPGQGRRVHLHDGGDLPAAGLQPDQRRQPAADRHQRPRRGGGARVRLLPEEGHHHAQDHARRRGEGEEVAEAGPPEAAPGLPARAAETAARIQLAAAAADPDVGRHAGLASPAAVSSGFRHGAGSEPTAAAAGARGAEEAAATAAGAARPPDEALRESDCPDVLHLPASACGELMLWDELWNRRFGQRERELFCI